MRTLCAAALSLALLGACSSGDAGTENGWTGGTEPTTSSTSVVTIPQTSVVTTLPANGRARTPPVDARGDFSAVGTLPSFDALADAIVAAIEQRRPAEGGKSLSSSSSASATNSTGTVVVRREGFADDTVAGEEYVVSVDEVPGGWAVVSATRSDICHRGVNGAVCS